MASQEYGLLEQGEEDLIHKSRLLPVEQRPFQRVTKRLCAPDSLIYTRSTQLPTPPPDDGTAASDDAGAEARAAREAALEQWRTDMHLDFAALSDSVTRIQLLRNSNEAERERYAAEKLRILSTAQAIRENTGELRSQLEEARNTLALRKTYDELAEKITSNRMLKPREDQAAQLEKLEAEIDELEEESRVYKRTWAERRDQFGRIVEEGRQMLRLIRDEKEEAERKEGMDGNDDPDTGAEGGPGSGREGASNGGTPRPDGSGDGQTPMSFPQGSGSQLVAQRGLLGGANSPARSFGGNSPAGTQGDDGERDADMIESGEVEEGEADDDTPGERMDVS